ncbi:putative nitrite reductase protein [Phaeoacremonium minimum UCRPA7]|uniref:Nitrite reductase [NAD(P)H] n=1 Tax=Phaeoacremonium minimum (strain UCR-PA7) TaxID=1286976 RepID=R8BK97_PHAM7|nr:putative nitrite reductase protein [Phaeoacremonium minimum UCRPA7]EON99736.1 putative nitrite reductase protein [Phaeoacremonium minimum UCRPA7]
MAAGHRKKLVVVGLGMVGISFIEKLLKLDARAREWDIVVIGEEAHLAYNRVGLTSFFEHRKVENLYLNPLEWYEGILDNALGWHLNKKVTEIHPDRKIVTCADGTEVSYDTLVLATGSDAVLPRHTPGHDANGVFVYRNIEDLERLIAFSATKKDTYGAVVGGGLLGLEAAKAMMDLETFKQVKVIERNRWVLSRQLDSDAGAMVVEQVRALGVDVMLSRRVGKIDTDGNNNVVGVHFEDGEYMPCSTVCFAIGVRPRDELARSAGIRCADRGGGIVVNDDLSTSEPHIYAIGECASWQSQTFGLIAPGVEMADVLSFNLTQAKLHQPRLYKRPDLSTKLKLLGVEVASFGDFFADRDGPKYLPARAARKKKAEDKAHDVKILTNGLPPPDVKALTYKDPFQNVYKKYIFTTDGKYLLGGMMIGDTKDYVKLVPLVKQQKELDIPPSELILGAKKDGDDDGDDLEDDTQICSCHNVTKGDVVNVVKDGTCKSLGDIKSCTKAGTGCGGCMPLVTSIFNKTMISMGNEVKNNLCPHFNYSRADLYNIVFVKRLRTLPEVMREAGVDPDSLGCEVCKPAVASIFASLWNKHVMDKTHHGLQDTNDRFLGNIQRNGTFSVVPRVSGGEITPDKMIVMGQVAKQYGLYTKITGGQRIDMFGAKKQDLLEIWKTLVDAGMESGHAYAKSLRTVKSCVGTTWCRFGIGDSVGMAVRLEERYKSIRSPHKIKGGVSGCVRECAEAQNKDFGLIATEKGFNIFVGGNGGAKPRHSEILAKDVPPAEVIPILDRYLMFYIRTADKLQRTARWLEGLPGGIKYLQEVILEDKLGINASLEAQMKELVDSYFDEWAEAIKNPAIAAKFKQFNNTEETVETVEVEKDRDQPRPVFWAKESAKEDFQGLRSKWSFTTWQPVIEASHFAGADSSPNGVSATIKRGDTQLALWRVRGRYFATQQMCPHKRAFVLSDGLIGEDTPATDEKGESKGDASDKVKPGAPWVSCPYHKRNYDLSSGSCKNDSELSIATFEAEERADGFVYIKLPPVEELDAELGTKKWMVKKGETKSQFEELDRKIKFIGQRAKKPGVKPHVELPMRKPVELMAGGGCGAAPDW